MLSDKHSNIFYINTFYPNVMRRVQEAERCPLRLPTVFHRQKRQTGHVNVIFQHDTMRARTNVWPPSLILLLLMLLNHVRILGLQIGLKVG